MREPSSGFLKLTLHEALLGTSGKRKWRAWKIDVKTAFEGGKDISMGNVSKREGRRKRALLHVL